MVGVRKVFGLMLLGVSVWLLERVLPAPVTLALWGLLAVGTALWLGPGIYSKPGKQKLAQLLGVALLVYGISSWVGALQGQTDPLRPLGRLDAQGLPQIGATVGWQTLDTPAALDAALLSAKTAGQPLLLDWYADWCISCKVIEREVLEVSSVREQLADYRLVRFDMTRSDAEQRALLDRYQLFGPPALQLFAPVVMSGRTFARLVKPTPRVFWNDCVKPTTECKACNLVAPGSRRQLADRSPPQHVLAAAES